MPSNLINNLKTLYRKVRPARTVPLIDESLWRQATDRYPFMQRLTAEENRRLRLIASDFLSRKNVVGAAELEINNLMKVEIAAQACILILELGADYYDGWQDIVLYPGQFRPKRQMVDEAGVVHETRDSLAGEAWLSGPVVLSYEDVARAAHGGFGGNGGLGTSGYNVVIHEFAHKLDMLNGNANGFPPLHKGMSNQRWKTVFMAAYLDFCKRVDEADNKARFDHGVSLDELPIDPYASENPAEFFAVISEAFFEIPENVRDAYPDVYRELAAFYKQDPLKHQYTHQYTHQ
jgi:MtfA peptidase